MALIIVLIAFGCLASGAALAVLITRARMAQRRRRDKARAMESKQIKALMFALMSTAEEVRWSMQGSLGVGVKVGGWVGAGW